MLINPFTYGEVYFYSNASNNSIYVREEQIKDKKKVSPYFFHKWKISRGHTAKENPFPGSTPASKLNPHPEVVMKFHPKKPNGKE